MINPNSLRNNEINAVIAGAGSAIPSGKLTNEDLEKIVETSDEWIMSRTGIKVRHICQEGETTATLAAEAATKALADAGMEASEIDMIVLATITPEMGFPSTACFVQDMIGASNAWAFDISAACSGFVYGLSIASQFVLGGSNKAALVIGAENLSSITDYEDRNSCVLFGDGAGAVVLKADTGGSNGVMYSCSSSDGGGWTSLKCEAYGSRYPVGKELDDPKKVYMSINGREIYQLAVRRIVELVEDCLDKCDLTMDQIDMFIPHQMNARIIESVGKRLKFAENHVFINIEKYGNTSAASIPIALADCLKEGKIKSGDIVLLAAFGAGLTWGANVIQF